MPSPGLSLVGFLDQQSAITHLRSACVLADDSDLALQAEWSAAKAKLGPAVSNAGTPDIQPLPAAGVAHVASLTQQPWVQQALQHQGALLGASFQLVEIDPLLAFQFTVDAARSAHHNGGLPGKPSNDELLSICSYVWSWNGGPSLNLDVLASLGNPVDVVYLGISQSDYHDPTVVSLHDFEH